MSGGRRLYSPHREKAITDAVVRIAKTSAEHTIVIFDDVAKEDWAQGGVPASEM